MHDVTRETEIAAPRDQVWHLLADVAWWIGDGDHADQIAGTREGKDHDVDVIIDPHLGTFRLRTEEYLPQTYITYRILDNVDDQPATLVEFFVVERAGMTVVRVVESGLSTEAGWQESYEKWGVQLDLLNATATQGRLWPWLEPTGVTSDAAG